jgi:hypothetical protein
VSAQARANVRALASLCDSRKCYWVSISHRQCPDVVQAPSSPARYLACVSCLSVPYENNNSRAHSSWRSCGGNPPMGLASCSSTFVGGIVTASTCLARTIRTASQSRESLKPAAPYLFLRCVSCVPCVCVCVIVNLACFSACLPGYRAAYVPLLSKSFISRQFAHGCACCVYSLIPWYSKKYKELITAGTKTSHLLLMNGCDHTAPDAQ